jgi:hypothetical protein
MVSVCVVGSKIYNAPHGIIGAALFPRAIGLFCFKLTTSCPIEFFSFQRSLASLAATPLCHWSIRA